MLSFRTELENPVVEKEILELDRKIKAYRNGTMPEQYFKSLRLARGIYGQRQKGVQMIRIKLPHGRLTLSQWKRIADISDEYATGKLHLTTRQDIQLHFVSLDKTPDLWAKLAEDKITIREACGNTVRNITGSSFAGIDPEEPFDVTPYAQAAFEYFVRNPICQDMGRKFKIAFSSSDKDKAWSFIHDVGLIPKIKEQDGKTVRGFKVLIGGGLGAQPYLAQEVFDFLEEDIVFPYIEAVIRVFDRYGERTNRMKARMKYLIAKLGLEEFTRLVKEEWKSLKNKHFQIPLVEEEIKLPAIHIQLPAVKINNQQQFERWKRTNIFPQKQSGYFAAGIRVPLGDISTDTSRRLIEKLKPFIADDVRVTPNQGFLLRYIREEHLPYVFSILEEEHVDKAGFDSTADITACPGTDTCNLGISSSTGIAEALEEVIENEFEDLIYNSDIHIKISGCMNSCGQHGIAQIGFHGSSMRSGKLTLPALQILLGGGIIGDGKGRTADKVIKIPSKRGPEALRAILHDYETHKLEFELFNDYYDRMGNKYFYSLLKPLADIENLGESDFIDWGREEQFVPAIGTGECASVVIDLIGALLTDAGEKLGFADEAIEETRIADAIYHAYSAFINTAKALLLDKEIACNTQNGILNDFDRHFSEEKAFSFPKGFREYVLRINQHQPEYDFATAYISSAKEFLENAKIYREEEVAVG
ncbi:MAG: HEPN domain-containing protein [Chitinophagaceae bacterium]|nr:MAG: HEPN domain-containing protein [Chitinophagaceae bacterium]